jgi:hypothetical protein
MVLFIFRNQNQKHAVPVSPGIYYNMRSLFHYGSFTSKISSMKKILFFYILLLFVSQHARTQIVNIESARMQSDTVGWQGGVGMALGLTQNTEKIFSLEAQTHLQYKTSNDMGLWLLLADYNYLKIGGLESISNQFVHLRYNRKVNEWLRWEFFTQYQNNAITQIDSRFLLGTGPRFKLIKQKYFRLYAGALFMVETEREKTDPVVKHNDLRNSSYISFTWLPNPNVQMLSTTYWQPQLKKLSDYRLLNQLVFKVTASPHFSVSMKWNYLHDRFPAGVAPRTTYSFSTGVDYDF